MPGVNAKLNLTANVTLEGTSGFGTPSLKTNVSDSISFQPGTASIFEADVLYSANRTLAASATEDLDLAGVLTNAFGATVSPAEIVGIYFKARADNTNSVVIGAATANPFLGPLNATGTITLKPGESVLLASQSGWSVTAGTADLLKVANSGAGSAVTYSVMLIGRSQAA